MRTLSQHDLHRLLRSHRRLKVSLLVTLAVIIAGLVLLIVSDASFPIPLGGVIGVCIGLVLLIPQRRLLAELGLTNVEAKEIITAERERRTGLAAMPPADRARRESVRARIFTVAGTVLVVGFFVAAYYFFSKAGQTVEEDAPTDPWFATSVFGGFAALCVGPALLFQAAQHRSAAESWRARADQDT
ncbi:hypothetical protein AB0M43_10925 [Longispora sp. NPDC051575]|uniref:hypothetical protein n=1 Tax=Longispora sp. NPDC051575 TaxID=3154943 RepID=UPI003421D0CD